MTQGSEDRARASIKDTLNLDTVGSNEYVITAVAESGYQRLLNQTDLSAPDFNLDGLSVLDVGCGNGWIMTHPRFARCASRTGIDIDSKALGEGLVRFPDLRLVYGSAESIPLSGPYDVVMSRVALPYVDIRVALAEMHRVMKPGSQLFLTTHDWRHWADFFLGAIKLKAPKNVLSFVYVAAASWVFALTGKVPKRPWNNTRETFQTEGRMRMELKRAGLSDAAFSRTARHWRITARKAE